MWTVAIIAPLLAGIIVGILTGPSVTSAPPTSQEAPSSYLNATCLMKKDKPQVTVVWQPVEGANKNVLMKEEATVSSRKNLVVEFTAPFKTYAFSDADVSFGKKYTYLVDTGVLDGWERVTVDVSLATCLKSNISSNER